MLILGFNALCEQTHQITESDISFNTYDMPSELREVTHSKLSLNYSFQLNSLNNTSLSFEVFKSGNEYKACSVGERISANNNQILIHKFVSGLESKSFIENQSVYNSTDKNVIKWSFEKDSGNGFIISFAENSSARLTILFLVIGGLGYFSTQSLSKDLDADIILLTRNAFGIRHATQVIFQFVYLIGLFLVLLNTAGGNHGIYVGLQIYKIKTIVGSFDLSKLLLNANPAHGFSKFGSGGV
jgi:hypothetical protein